MIVLGLTGGLAMGKSTIAAMLKAKGVPVHNADDAVHRLYGGEAVAPVLAAFPGTAINGRIDRTKLGAMLKQPQDWARLEQIVHPLVRQDRDMFLARAARDNKHLAVLDVPLLFETGMNAQCDAVMLASAPTDVQRQRAMTRPGMTAEKFEHILAKQMPDADKRRLAHYVIATDVPLQMTARRIDGILRAYAGR